jgi:hypothetical protein
MIFEEIQVGDFVHDVNNSIAGGRVIKKLKTRVKVYFATGIRQPYTSTYDRSHCRFLRKEDR